MLVRLLAVSTALLLGPGGAEAGRLAPSMGQYAYLGGNPAPHTRALVGLVAAARSDTAEASPFQEAEAQAQAAFDAGEPSKAAAALAKLIDPIEKDERGKAGKPGPQTASALTSLAWYRLFAHDFKGALAASERAAAASPDPIYATNRAHALMFLGRSYEAKHLHQIYKGRPIDNGGKLWETAILDDFSELQKRGLKHAQMAEIETLLTAAAPSPAPAQAQQAAPSRRRYSPGWDWRW